MVQCADRDARAADIAPKIIEVKRSEDDVISLRIGHMPAVGNRLEVRVRDVEEEGIVRQGSPAGAHLRMIDRDLFAVAEGQRARRRGRLGLERENDAAPADRDSGIPGDRNGSRRPRCGSREFGERYHTVCTGR